MSSPDPAELTLWIAALASEGPAMRAAAEHLAVELREAGCPVRVALRSLARDALPEGGGRHVAILSLSSELAAAPESVEAARTRWTQRIERLQGSGVPCVLCTVFRHTGARIPGHPDPLGRRIAQLNLLAAQLSQATHASVADVDRCLCELGARALRTDFRIGTGAAATLAGHAIARAVLMEALEGQLPPQALERASETLGSVRAFIRRAHSQRVVTP